MALTRHSHIHDAHIEKALRDTYPRFRILSISPSRRARLRGHVRRAAHTHPPSQPRHPQERTRRASTTRSHGRPGRVAQEARAARGPRRQRRGPVAAAAGPQGRREAREPRSRRLRHGDQAPGRRRRRRRPGPQAAVLGARRARALLPVTQPRRQLRLRRLVGHHDDDDDGGGPRGARRGRRGRLVGRDGGGGGGARAAPDEGAGKREGRDSASAPRPRELQAPHGPDGHPPRRPAAPPAPAAPHRPAAKPSRPVPSVRARAVVESCLIAAAPPSPGPRHPREGRRREWAAESGEELRDEIARVLGAWANVISRRVDYPSSWGDRLCVCCLHGKCKSHAS